MYNLFNVYILNYMSTEFSIPEDYIVKNIRFSGDKNNYTKKKKRKEYDSKIILQIF